MDIQHGDLIKIGNHYLLCGDATKEADVRKLLRGERIQLIVSDPPYGCSVVEKQESFTGKPSDHKVIQNDNIDNVNDYAAFTASWMKPIAPFMADKNALYIFCIDRMTFPIREAMEQGGYRFTQLLIWLKTQAIVGRLDYIPQTELIIYGWRGTHSFYKAKDKNVLVHPKPAKSPLHPSTKPVPLIGRLILNSSRVGDVIYDGFLGSGTTMVAAEKTKRRCYGMEIDPEYCQTIVDRMEKLGYKAEKLTS